MHDEYTKGHSENVAKLSILIGKNLNLNDNDLETLYWASLLHDIGKVLIPVEILNKKNKLTNYEFSKIKEHPTLGYNATKNSKSLSRI
jgi:HD-GYP domain-containing protein (c-di-GMP phosphodiesterase class II)